MILTVTMIIIIWTRVINIWDYLEVEAKCQNEVHQDKAVQLRDQWAQENSQTPVNKKLHKTSDLHAHAALIMLKSQEPMT